MFQSIQCLAYGCAIETEARRSGQVLRLDAESARPLSSN